eukprot:Tamp_13796.p1 GENE.Tamp_13796~~Tamp_13796.p1  ORF type:complete len:374 (+),score=61.17 Tamp_13796:42-1124(+)
MVRPLLARSGLQVLGRATGSPRRWVGAPRAPAAAGEHGGEWRRISSGGVRQGGGAQQQAGGPRAEPFCSADSAAATPAGGAGSLAAFCSRALNGAAPHKTSGAGRAANEHASNGQANGVNGVSHVHSMPNLGGSITDAVAPEHHNEHHAHVDPRQRAREVILGGAATLQRLAATVDETFDQAVALIEGRGKGSRVIVVGIGKSGHLARKMSATLSSTGTASFFMHGTEALHGDLGGAQAGDVAILLSNSGETEEVLQAAQGLRRAGASTIALTAHRNNTLAASCDLCLSVGVHEELDHNGLAPTASGIATMSLGDALALVLSQRSKFTTRDFSRCHPAGQLGKIASAPRTTAPKASASKT